MFYIDIGHPLHESVECIIWLKNIVRLCSVNTYCTVLTRPPNVTTEAKKIQLLQFIVIGWMEMSFSWLFIIQ